MALASAPLFLAKLPTGILSGVLLETFCPQGASCEATERAACAASDPSLPAPGAAPAALPPSSPVLGRCDSKLWLVIGAITMASPLLITLFQRWLRPAPDASSYAAIQLEESGQPSSDLRPERQAARSGRPPDASFGPLPRVPEEQEPEPWEDES